MYHYGRLNISTLAVEHVKGRGWKRLSAECHWLLAVLNGCRRDPYHMLGIVLVTAKGYNYQLATRSVTFVLAVP